MFTLRLLIFLLGSTFKAGGWATVVGHFESSRKGQC